MPLLSSEAQPRSSGTTRAATERFGFSGHETFPFRYGWLKKAADAVLHEPGVLSQDRALVVLGVGKNMVQSIRHWGLATQLLADGTSPRSLMLTPVGQLLLEEWDPHLEDPASLWLVHWLLVTNPARAATWHLTFNRFTQHEFSKAELLDFLLTYAERHGTRLKHVTASRDVDCLVRTYVASRNPRHLMEDSFDCPLAELNLLHQLRDGETYRFTIGPKTTLPTEVFGFALYQYIERSHSATNTVPLHDCIYRPGSPGQAFKLDHASIEDYLETLRDITGSMEFHETAGLTQVYFLAKINPISLLQTYYERGVANA